MCNPGFLSNLLKELKGRNPSKQGVYKRKHPAKSRMKKRTQKSTKLEILRKALVEIHSTKDLKKNKNK